MNAWLKVASVIIGFCGAIYAAAVMLVYWMVGAVLLSDFAAVATLGYPLFMLVTAFVAAKSLRAGVVSALLALVSSILLVIPFLEDEWSTFVFVLGVGICAPAVMLVAACAVGLVCDRSGVGGQNQDPRPSV